MSDSIFETDETILKSNVYDVIKEYMEENPDADAEELGWFVKGAMKSAAELIAMGKQE